MHVSCLVVEKKPKQSQALPPDDVKHCGLNLMPGSFHTIKTLLKATGKSLEGSGAENIWLEANVYGANTIQTSVLTVRYYQISLKAQTLFAEAMGRLRVKEFFDFFEISDY